MSSWEITARLKRNLPGDRVAVCAAVGRDPDDTRDGLKWICRDVGEANRAHRLLSDSEHVQSVTRRQRKVSMAARGLMSLALLAVLTLPGLAQENQSVSSSPWPPIVQHRKLEPSTAEIPKADPQPGNSCPADRPHRLSIAQPPQTAVNLNGCPVRMYCRDAVDALLGSKCWYAPDSACRAMYQPRVIDICLTDAELEAARK